MLEFLGREAACVSRWERLVLGLCLGLPASLAACQASQDSGGHTLQAPGPSLCWQCEPGLHGHVGSPGSVLLLHDSRGRGPSEATRKTPSQRWPGGLRPPLQLVIVSWAQRPQREEQVPVDLTASGIHLHQGKLREK